MFSGVDIVKHEFSVPIKLLETSNREELSLRYRVAITDNNISLILISRW